MAMCLGWKKMKNCGRDETVVPPGTTCPDIGWFWLAAAATAVAAFIGRRKQA